MQPYYLLGAITLALAALLIWQHVRVRRAARSLMERMEAGSTKTLPPTLAELDQQFSRHHDLELKLKGRVSRREQLLGLILDGSRDAVLVVDSSEAIRFANAKAIDFLALDGDPVGRPAKQLLLDVRLVSMLRSSTEERKHISDTLIQSAAIIGSDRDRVLEVDISPLVREDKDRVSRTSLVIRDVTARHELEQVRKDFVANASHELRTPLSIINGYLETLIDDDQPDQETTRRFLSIMKKHGDRLARIIEDMLAISTLESSPSEALQMDEFDLEICAREVVARLDPVFETKKARSTIEFKGDSHRNFFGDRFYWDQIFFNLIENALKENDSENLNITISAQPQGGDDIITVADNGIGIPQEDLPFIFKRFYRVDKQHSPERKGTGLGLSIVKRAVEAHGGEIDVQSTPGRETVFIMRVPRRRAGNGTSPKAPPSAVN